MPDDLNLESWRALVRERLPALPVEEARRTEIEDELAQWLRDAADAAGLARTDPEFDSWLTSEVPAWEELAQSLVRADRPALGRVVSRAGLERTRARFMVGALGDLRYALRTLRQSPGFAAVAILTMAFGIGLNSAVFSLLNSLLFKPLPIERVDELLRVFTHEPGGFLDHMMFSYPGYEDLGRLESLESVAGFAMTFVAVEGEDRAELVFGEIVTGSYFPVLGLRPVRGRMLTAEDDRFGDPANVAVVSYNSWRNRFGAAEDLVGTEVRINGRPLTIVGIVPAGFKGGMRGMEMEVWLPLSTAEAINATPGTNDGFMLEGETRRTSRGRKWLWPIARLAPGTSVEQAEAEIAALGSSLETDYPATNDERSFRTLAMSDVKAVPAIDAGLNTAAVVLLAVVGLVLLIACANLANLLLARALGRNREMATRLSLGAGTVTLVRQLMIESLLISGIGSALGLGIAFAANRVTNGIEVPMLVPISVTTTIDGRVVAFTLLLAAGTALFFGLAPALQAARTDLAPLLREESARGGSGKRRRLQSGLVAAQVALSVVLLAFGALSLRSALNAQNVEIGFEPIGAASMTLSPDLQGYSDADIEQFYRRLKSSLAALPGVSSVTASSQVPLTLFINTTNVIAAESLVDDIDEWPDVDTASVDEDYFETLRIPIVAGRDFDAVDAHDQRRVVIINESLARRLWQDENPIGRQVRTGINDSEPRTVVGVAKDGKYRTLGEQQRSFLYGPIDDSTAVRAVVVRFDRPEQAVPRLLAQALRGIDDSIAISTLGTLPEVIGTVFFLPRASAIIFGVLGALGLGLAAMGLYGVLAYAVGQRSHEIGIRVAMGARRGDIVRLVVIHGLLLTATGLAIGLAGALASTRALSAILYDVSPTDFGAFAAVVVVLLSIAAVAAYIPARRATRMDPMIALRSD